ncbi:hypothetical protein MNV49_004243 [Pseudohyphozyma bogoriensis]|nr:hypothetical protein MNV49_004243 [Pseudohyphozyma bogoriensis]
MVADRTPRGLATDVLPSYSDILESARSFDVEKRQAGASDKDMSAANFYIPTLPGLPADSSLKMWGGHIPSEPPVGGVAAKSSEAHLFFFMIRNRHIADKSRTIFWFNGGPGCSSFDGSLMEIGPLRLVPGSGGELKEVEGAWNEYANIVFIDQPIGTGYSYGSTNAFVHELPETYIAGESYAGQYIPFIADAILATATLPTRLKGLLIGNGWIDPLNQYPAYLEFALSAGVVKKGSDVESRIRKDVDRCVNMLTQPNYVVKVHNAGCEGILGAITDSTVQSVNGLNMCVNNYDVRLTDTHPACGMNWPPDLSDITPYLRRDDVKTAFHATRKSGGWSECNGAVGANFWAVQTAPSVSLFPKLLKQVPILFFAGDQDLICNHVGIERMIDEMTWGGEKGFGNASDPQEWYVDGKEAGTWQYSRNVTYVKIKDASHMVPYDQPLAAHDMFLRFAGANLLGAAGPAAQVPSRVGDELEAVLGATHPNGTAVSSGDSSSSQTGGSPATHASNVDALVNASSAIVLVAILLFASVGYLILRRRRQHRRRNVSQHSRSMSGRGHKLPDAGDEGPHELDELVEGEEHHPGESSADDRDFYLDVEKGRSGVKEEGEIFGLGSDDDEDRRAT